MNSKGLYCLLHGDQLPHAKINCISALSNTPFLAVPSPSEETRRVNTRHNWQAKILPVQHLSKVYFSLAMFLFLYLKPLYKKPKLYLTICYFCIARWQQAFPNQEKEHHSYQQLPMTLWEVFLYYDWKSPRKNWSKTWKNNQQSPINFRAGPWSWKLALAGVTG